MAATFGRCIFNFNPAASVCSRPNINQIRHRNILKLLFQNTCTCAKSRNISSLPSSSFGRFQTQFSKSQQKAFLSTKQASNKTSGPISWKSLLVFAAAGAGVWYYGKILKEGKEKAKEAEKNRSIGMASLGGPFDLVDQDGNKKTDKDFLGQWILIYFGFCHCPDICPDQLDKMADVIETLDNTKGLPTIQPLFITVDPSRDDAKTIKEYLQDFHPRMIGLTGAEAQVKAVTKAYRVYYSAGPMDEDNDYIVDHTIITYLVNPEGKFVEYFGQNKTVEEITSTIGTRMVNYKYRKQ